MLCGLLSCRVQTKTTTRTKIKHCGCTAVDTSPVADLGIVGSVQSSQSRPRLGRKFWRRSSGKADQALDAARCQADMDVLQKQQAARASRNRKVVVAHRHIMDQCEPMTQPDGTSVCVQKGNANLLHQWNKANRRCNAPPKKSFEERTTPDTECASRPLIHGESWSPGSSGEGGEGDERQRAQRHASSKTGHKKRN